MDGVISPPVAALLKNQTQDSLLDDLSPIGGSSPGNCGVELLLSPMLSVY